MSAQFVAKSHLTNWQVAPAEFEIQNYDEPKIRYRKYVEEYVASVSNKSLKKKAFITISTNVLCAVKSSSKPELDPIDRDHYIPLEIALTKWSMSEANKPVGERAFETTVWLMNPGPPPSSCNCQSLDHRQNHKIDYTKLVPGKDNCSANLESVLKDFNSKLLPDRTVFSISLRHCRQDLGALKWLVCQTGLKVKPVNVYSLEDLYVVYMRRLMPDLGLGQGVAHHRLVYSSNSYDPSKQCAYHRNLLKVDDEHCGCGCCAKAITLSYTQVLMDDVKLYSSLLEQEEPPVSSEAASKG